MILWLLLWYLYVYVCKCICKHRSVLQRLHLPQTCEHACVRAWLCSMLVSCRMCETAVISLSGVWECEEETRWGSRLMKDLHLPHMHAHTHSHYKHIRSHMHSEVLLLLLQITWLHGNTLMDHHDKVSIDLLSITWRHNEICHIVFVHNT